MFDFQQLCKYNESTNTTKVQKPTLIFLQLFCTFVLMKGNENMAKLPETLRTAVKRKRGEQNISVIELATQTGVSRWTLDKILKGTTDNVRPTTVSKLNEWLYKQM